ncbi:MAG: peptidase E [Acidimicrobiia bacterium]|nr:peptidase E [Acidimicrobiia bacterium]
MAIGGGEIGRPGLPGDTTEIDAAIVRLADKPRPRLLFVGTATQDDPGYFAIVQEHYGRRLGCEVSALGLYGRGDRRDDASRQIHAADIVYVGGGNTLRMMNLWRRRGVDEILARAALDGTIMAGISAGAICWATKGVSDSRSYTAGDDPWSFIAVRGLGLIDLLLCPHFEHRTSRSVLLTRMAVRAKRPGLGLPDCTALQVMGDQWRILSCRDGATAHRVGVTGDAASIAASERFAPLGALVHQH